MSATLERERTGSAPARSGVSFGGVIRSEWIKLFSLRSTLWCLALVVVITVGLGALVAWSLSGVDETLPGGEQAIWVQSIVIGVSFSQLVVAVLGALVITGEYSTGMIRSTLTAAPGRLPALGAKALVLAATMFVVGLATLIATAALTAAILRGTGVEPDVMDQGVWWSLIGAAGYLALLAVLSVAIGALIRNSAGGISAALGLIFVLPVILNLLAGLTQAQWATNVATFLPDAAGRQMSAYVTGPQPAIDGIVVLEPWQGLLVILAWVGVLFTLAGVTLKSRDA